MIEIHYYKNTILVLETQYFSCCLLHFSNSYLSIYLKTKQKKTAKQISKRDKTKKKKKRKKGKRRSEMGFEPCTFRKIRPHIATTPLRMSHDNQSNLMLFIWNFRRQTTGANNRAIKTTRRNGVKLRLIETRLLTVKNNVNAFHGNERTYAIQSRHNSSAK